MTLAEIKKMSIEEIAFWIEEAKKYEQQRAEAIEEILNG
ncbi:hypothetical protein THER_2040 [Thermodesulfovibrio sp. N1]|nr:hypothetical protein THER_2040 [Thermodesulfovibrio sp. N1]